MLEGGLALKGPLDFRCTKVSNFSKSSTKAGHTMVLITPFDKIVYCSDKTPQLNFSSFIKND